VSKVVIGAMSILFACGAAWAAPAEGAKPFGIAIGSSSCEEAASVLGTKPALDSKLNIVMARAPNPTRIFPGASIMFAICHPQTGKVVALFVQARKGELRPTVAQEAYRNMASKYKLVKGGPIPDVGDGFARFSAGDSVVTLESPHMEFDFLVKYETREGFERRMNSEQDQASKETAKRKGL